MDLCPQDLWVVPLYFATFNKDATRKVWVYSIEGKDDAYPTFKKWLVSVELEKDIKLKALRLDNGSEYTSHKFGDFCKSSGIQREFTTPYTLSRMVWLRG